MQSPSATLQRPLGLAIKFDEVLIGRVIAFLPLILGLVAISIFFMDLTPGCWSLVGKGLSVGLIELEAGYS